MIRTHILQAFIEVSDRDRSEGVIAPHGLEVEVMDEGAGPWLECKPRNFDHVGSDPPSLSLTSEAEIDGLCAALKAILREAEANAGECPGSLR